LFILLISLVVSVIATSISDSGATLDGLITIGNLSVTNASTHTGNATFNNVTINDRIDYGQIQVISPTGEIKVYKDTTNNAYSRGQLLVNAIGNVSVNNSVVKIGPGNFTLNQTQINLTIPISIIGSGANTIIFRSTSDGLVGISLQSSNVDFRDFTLESYNQVLVEGSGNYTNVTFWNVGSLGIISADFLVTSILYTGSKVQARFFSCDLHSTWDILAGSNLEVEVYNSNLQGGTPTVINMISGNNIKIFGGKISGATIVSMQSAVNVVEFYNVWSNATVADFNDPVAGGTLNTIRVVGGRGSGGSGLFNITSGNIRYTDMKFNNVTVGNITVTNLINLILTTIQACNSVTNRTIQANASGVYGCNNTGSWVKIF